MAPRRRDVRGAEAMDQGDRQIAEGGQNLWGEAFAQAGAIFLEADLAHIMGSIFDAPMPTTLVQQAIWTGLGGREDGDKIDHLAGSLARFGHRASELSDLRDKRPRRSQIGMHLGTDLAGAPLEASPSSPSRLRFPLSSLPLVAIGP